MAEYINRASLMGKLTSGDMQMRLREMDGGEAYNVFLTLVNSEPDADVVSMAVLRQVMWERDMAIDQLREDYGVGLGEKKLTCKDCKHYHEGQGWCDKHSHFDQDDWEMFYEDDYCSCGERRDSDG